MFSIINKIFMLISMITSSVKKRKKACFEKGAQDLKSRDAVFSKVRADTEAKNS